MYPKKAISTIAISIAIMVLLMYLIYDFELTGMNVSNVFFFMGIVYFFPGLIVVTNASELFQSVGYLSRRIFFRPRGDGNDFKTLSDYIEYKHIKNAGRNPKRAGRFLLILGSAYILISIVIGLFA